MICPTVTFHLQYHISTVFRDKLVEQGSTFNKVQSSFLISFKCFLFKMGDRSRSPRDFRYHRDRGKEDSGKLMEK